MPMSAGRHRASFPDVELSYEVTGSGPPLLAVSSGWGVGSRYLTRGLTPLTDRFTLICLATRGSGGSSRPADDTVMGTTDMATDIELLRRHLGLGAIDLFGHSNGGAIALEFAARYPESCRKLVLTDSQLIGFPASDATQRILEDRSKDARFADAVLNFQSTPVFEDDAFTDLILSFFPLYFHDPEVNMQKMIDTFDLPISAWAAENQWAADARPSAIQVELLSEISAETLVIVGEDDFITPVPVSERIRDGIRGSRLMVCPDCGHVPWIEQPELFFKEVASFLSR